MSRLAMLSSPASTTSIIRSSSIASASLPRLIYGEVSTENLQRYAPNYQQKSNLLMAQVGKSLLALHLLPNRSAERTRESPASHIIYSEVKFSRNRANRITHKISDWLFHLHRATFWLFYTFFFANQHTFLPFSFARQQRDSSACFVTVALRQMASARARMGGSGDGLKGLCRTSKLLHDRASRDLCALPREE